MRGKKAVDHLDQVEVPKAAHGAPVCRLATPWFHGYGRFIRVDLAVICPKCQQPECHLTLCRWELKKLLEAIPDEAIAFAEKSGGEDPVR